MRVDTAQLCSEFLEKLRAGAFKTSNAAIHSISRRKISSQQKLELRGYVAEYFDTQVRSPLRPGIPPSEPSAPLPWGSAAVSNVSEAYLLYLKEAIQTNVTLVHGFREARETQAELDVTEVQAVINHLSHLSERYNVEMGNILRSLEVSLRKRGSPEGG